MKTIFGVLAVIGLMLPPAWTQEEKSLNVVTTLTDFGKIAEAIGGDRVRVTTIASGLQDPHVVDPKPSYIVKLRDADLLIVNGLDLEVGWVPPLLDGARNPRIKPGSAGYVDCSKDIPVAELPSGDVTRAMGDVHPRGNPHYMTDPLNGKIVAETIAEAFKQAAPANAEYFETRKKSFQHGVDEAMFGKELVDLVGGKKLDRLCRAGELDDFLEKQTHGDAKLSTKLGGWMGKMRPLKGQKVIFNHRSYSYFTARFALDVVNYVELKPGIQPGGGHLADLVLQIRRDKIPVVAIHPFGDKENPAHVAEKGNARLIVLPLTVGGVKGADDYVKFFDVVTDTFVQSIEK